MWRFYVRNEKVCARIVRVGVAVGFVAFIRKCDKLKRDRRVRLGVRVSRLKRCRVSVALPAECDNLGWGNPR